MVDLQNQAYCPTLEEMGEAVQNPLFQKFCARVSEQYQTTGRMEFSKCSWAPGWNVKFRKSGKSLCTVYPHETYFAVLVVVGPKEKKRVEALLPACSPAIRRIYRETREGNGQRWLMIDLEDGGATYEDVFRLLAVRSERG